MEIDLNQIEMFIARLVRKAYAHRGEPVPPGIHVTLEETGDGEIMIAVNGPLSFYVRGWPSETNDAG